MGKLEDARMRGCEDARGELKDLLLLDPGGALSRQRRQSRGVQLFQPPVAEWSMAPGRWPMAPGALGASRPCPHLVRMLRLPIVPPPLLCRDEERATASTSTVTTRVTISAYVVPVASDSTCSAPCLVTHAQGCRVSLESRLHPIYLPKVRYLR